MKLTTEAQRIKAAELMGWTWTESENSEGPCLKWTPPTGAPWKWDSENYQPPAYDASADAAMELVEWMAKAGWKWQASEYNGAVLFMFYRGRSVDNNYEELRKIAPTLPLAILGAFLRCHGIDPDL